MIKATLGILGGAAIILLAATFGNVSAETAKAPKPPACNTLKEEIACTPRDRLPVGGRRRRHQDRQGEAQGLLPTRAG